MNMRLASALGAYAILTAIAFRVLHGKALYAVLILFGGLAVKTFVADRTGR